MDRLSPKFDAKAFCARVRQVRALSGRSATQLAILAGLPRGTVHAFEREETGNPTPATVTGLCWSCDLSADWLLFGLGKEPAEARIRKALDRAKRFWARQQTQQAELAA